MRQVMTPSQRTVRPSQTRESEAYIAVVESPPGLPLDDQFNLHTIRICIESTLVNCVIASKRRRSWAQQ